MPLKAAIIPHLDEITPESRLTGAVNTVVRVQTAEGLKLVGTNTDFLGMYRLCTSGAGEEPDC